MKHAITFLALSFFFLHANFAYASKETPLSKPAAKNIVSRYPKTALFLANVIESLLIHRCTQYLGLQKPQECKSRQQYLAFNVGGSFPTVLKLFGIKSQSVVSKTAWYKPYNIAAFGLFSVLLAQNYAVLANTPDPEQKQAAVRDSFLLSAGAYIAAWLLYFGSALVQLPA